jgi:Flp pilus assembly protein CpaB
VHDHVDGGAPITTSHTSAGAVSATSALLDNNSAGVAVPRSPATPPVTPGDHVDVLALPQHGDAAVVATDATVIAVDETAVTVSVDEDDAPSVAGKVASETVALVMRRAGSVPAQ